MQCIPAISISNGQPAMLFPLIIILCASMLKDAYEDRQRYNADCEDNNKPCEVYDHLTH